MYAAVHRTLRRRMLKEIHFLISQKSFICHEGFKRVVVTGLGVLSPIGFDANRAWKAILEGQCGIRKLGKEYSRLPCSIAATISHGRSEDKDVLDLTKHFPKSSLRTMSLSTAYAVLATQEALKDANWLPKDVESLLRTGVAVGVGMVDLQEVCNTNAAFKMGYSKISPYFLARILPNMAAGHISMKYGFKGPVQSVSTACTTGAHSIGDAFRYIRCGDADVMVCGSAEASICPLSIAAFCRLRALSTTSNDEPSRASRPFDRDRDGFIVGEGAAVFVLEELQHALNRGVRIQAEVLGYGMSSDATQLSAQVEEDGCGEALSMQRALKDANLRPSEIGYINAHAPSTRIGDAIETRAIKRVFGDHSKNLYVSSTKGAHGHLLGAAGNLESVFAVKAVATGSIPPTLNFKNASEGMDLNFVPNVPVEWTSRGRRVALKNSFGFAGSNATLIFAEYIPSSTEFVPTNFEPTRKRFPHCDIEN